MANFLDALLRGGAAWRDGNGDPPFELGHDGDYYLDRDSGDVYARAAGAYAFVTNLHGDAGTPGAAGEAGTAPIASADMTNSYSGPPAPGGLIPWDGGAVVAIGTVVLDIAEGQIGVIWVTLNVYVTTGCYADVLLNVDDGTTVVTAARTTIAYVSPWVLTRGVSSDPDVAGWATMSAMHVITVPTVGPQNFGVTLALAAPLYSGKAGLSGVRTVGVVFPAGTIFT
jgi:hypothetical protein